MIFRPHAIGARRMRSRHRFHIALVWVQASCASVSTLAASESATAWPEKSALDSLDAMELIELEMPMVVTATRHMEDIRDVPHALSVITAEDIRHAGARSVPEALRLVPGVDVASIAGGLTAVSVRGFHGLRSSIVLVLVDGRQIYDAVFGGTFWAGWPFQVEDIERIEVLRGPGGVSWGANAVNGVINIITKDPADQQGLTITTSGGSRGMHKGHVGYGVVDGKLRLRVSTEYEGDDGYARGGTWMHRLDDSNKGARMGVHAIYDASPTDTITLSVASSAVDGMFPPGVLDGGRLQNPGTQANHLLGEWQREIEVDNVLTLRGFVNDFHTDLGNQVADYRYQQLALQVGHAFRPIHNHRLSWGIDSRNDLVNGARANPHMLYRDHIATGNVGIYIQDTWTMSPGLSLGLGARVDYDYYGGFEPSGRASLLFRVNEDSLLYAAIARAVQIQPAARFADMPIIGGLAYVRLDPDISSTHLLAYEVGCHVRLFDQLDVHTDLYWHEYRDLTSFDPRIGWPLVLAFDNTADASGYGFEFEARYRASKRLRVRASYTFEHIDWRSEAILGYTLGADLITAPKHKLALGVTYSMTDDIHLSSQVYAVDHVLAINGGNPVSPLRIDSYVRLDVRAEYEFFDDRASIALGVRNVLDPHHYEGGSGFVCNAEVPRTLYAEFRVHIR